MKIRVKSRPHRRGAKNLRNVNGASSPRPVKTAGYAFFRFFAANRNLDLRKRMLKMPAK
jgi:hypothetical protein